MGQDEIPSEAVRAAIRDAFNDRFGFMPLPERAALVGVSPRTMMRFKSRKTLPQVETARRMERQLVRAKEFELPEEEQEELRERKRLARVKEQQRVHLHKIEDHFEHPQPPWHIQAIAYLEQNQPSKAEGLLAYQLDPEGKEWISVPNLVRPHALSNYGLALQRQGEHWQAHEQYLRALDALAGIPKGQQRRTLEALIRANLGTVLLQLNKAKEALDELERGSAADPTRLEPLLNALCAAAQLAADDKASFLAGRLAQACYAFDDTALLKLTERLDNDPDLNRLRNRPWWDAFAGHVRAERERRGPQDSLAIAA